MSYRGQRRFGAGMGDVSLVSSAVLSPLIVQIDRALTNMTAKWHPTGFYTPDMVIALCNHVITVKNQITGPMESYIASTASADTRWTARIALDLAQQSAQPLVPLIKAAGQAKVQGIAFLDAPGLRGAIISTYGKLLLALRGFRAVETYDSAILNSLIVFANSLMVLHDVAMVVVGVTKTAVQAAVAAGEAMLTVPDTLSTIFSIGKWVALGLGGVWLWHYAKENKGRIGL